MLRSCIRIVTQALHIYEPLYRLYMALIAWKVQRRFQQDFDGLLDQLRHVTMAEGEKPCLLVTGILETVKKPTLLPFLRQVSERAGMKLILLDEQEKPEKQDQDHFYIPRAIRVRGYDSFAAFRLTKTMKADVENDRFLAMTADYLYQRQNGTMTRSYAQAMTWYYAQIYQAAIDAYHPRTVLIWSKFSALHQLCDHICRKNGVTPLYMEYGSIPGTFALDAGGQMGESYAAREYKAFRELPVSQEECEQARAVLNYLRESRLNRNAQQQDTEELDRLRKELSPDKPVVLFAGQNDFDSGLLPYDEHAKENHSPMFADSRAAVLHLFQVAQTMGFSLVFKPHPAMVDRIKRMTWPDDLHVVKSTDINSLIDCADLVITIVSQTNYVSSIRQKATLSLGYNQLRGKGVTYEAYTENDIPAVITQALSHGMTLEMKENFVNHTAQMLKYALYDDLTERPVRFGASMDQAADFILQHIQ